MVVDEASPDEFHHVPPLAMTAKELRESIRDAPDDALVEILLPERPTCHPEGPGLAICFTVYNAGFVHERGKLTVLGDFDTDIYSLKEELFGEAP